MTLSIPRLTAVGALLVGIAIFALGALPGRGEAYQFPRLMGLVMILLAAILVLRVFLVKEEENAGGDRLYPWGALWPGLLIMLGVMVLAETVGFYVTCFTAFLITAVVYSPPPRLAPMGLLRRLVVSVAFIAVIYIVFTSLLGVQTPRGWLV